MHTLKYHHFEFLLEILSSTTQLMLIAIYSIQFITIKAIKSSLIIHITSKVIKTTKIRKQGKWRYT